MGVLMKRKFIIKQPVDSKITIEKTDKDCLIKIPSAKFCPFNLFLIVIISATLFGELHILLDVGYFGFVKPIILGVFLITLISYFLFYYFAETYIYFSNEKLVLKRQVFSFNIRYNRCLANLIYVSNYFLIRNSYNANVFVILLEFEGERNIKFGSHLSEKERKWLIEQLIILNKYYLTK